MIELERGAVGRFSRGMASLQEWLRTSPSKMSLLACPSTAKVRRRLVALTCMSFRPQIPHMRMLQDPAWGLLSGVVTLVVSLGHMEGDRLVQKRVDSASIALYVPCVVCMCGGARARVCVHACVQMHVVICACVCIGRVVHKCC